MKIYVINLDRAPERMERIARLLDAMGVPYERVAAVDGSALPATDVPDGAFAMTPAEIATVLSHRKCWDLFERSGEPHCLVLEDDVHFGSDFPAFVLGDPALPADFDLIKIETTPNKVWLDRPMPRLLFGRRKLLRLASPHLGAAGYVLSRSGLAKLHGILRGDARPVDILLFGQEAGALTIYQMAPSLIIQDNGLKNGPNYVGFASAIKRGRKPKALGIQKIKREIARVFHPYWPPGPLERKWRLSYRRVEFE